MILRLFFAVLAAAATIAQAQQYRWVDEKGRVQYSDTPPPPGAKDVRKRDLRGGQSEAPVPYSLGQALKNAPVTLYSHPDCKDPCQLARDVLNRRGIPFGEKVVLDDALLDELKRVSGADQVPVLVVGRVVERTISADAYNAALDTAGYPAAGILPPRRQGPPEAPKPAPAEPPAEERKPPAEEPPRKLGPYAPR